MLWNDSFQGTKTRNTDHAIARHLRCIVSYLHLLSVFNKAQYQTCLVMTAGCLCRRTQPKWTFYASVARVRWSEIYRSVRTGSVIISALGVSMASSSALLRNRIVAGWSFFKTWFSGTAVCVILGTNRQEMAHSPLKELSSAILADSLFTRIAPAVWHAVYQGLGRTMRPTKLVASVGKPRFVSLMVGLIQVGNEKTFWTCWILCSSVLLKIMM